MFHALPISKLYHCTLGISIIIFLSNLNLFRCQPKVLEEHRISPSKLLQNMLHAKCQVKRIYIIFQRKMFLKLCQDHVKLRNLPKCGKFKTNNFIIYTMSKWCVTEYNVWRMILKSCAWRLILKCYVWLVSGGRQTQYFEKLRLAGVWRNVLKSHVRRNVSKSGVRRNISKSSTRRNFLWPCIRRVSWVP